MERRPRARGRPRGHGLGGRPHRRDPRRPDRGVRLPGGGRSGAVASALAGPGYDVRNLDGGMLAWEAAGLPVVDRPKAARAGSSDPSSIARR